jgi:hypothetical protein
MFFRKILTTHSFFTVRLYIGRTFGGDCDYRGVNRTSVVGGSGSKRSGKTFSVCESFETTGIGVHNFHDSKNGLPPMGTGNTNVATSPTKRWNVSFWGIILPFLEQESLWQLVPSDLYCRMDRWNNDTYFPEEARKAVGSVPIYRCPSRRGNGPIYLPKNHFTTLVNEVQIEPQNDYGFVNTCSGGAYWSLFFENSLNNFFDKINRILFDFYPVNHIRK